MTDPRTTALGRRCSDKMRASARLVLHLPGRPPRQVGRLRDLVRRRSSSPPARPTCPASSKTPKATRRPPTCRASAESTKALNATESLQNGRNRPRGDRLPPRVGTDRRRPRTIVEDVEKMTAKRFPGVVPDGATAAAGGKQQDTEERLRRRRPKACRRLRQPDQHGPRPARRLRALRRPDLLAGRQGGDRHRLHQGQRRGRTDPRPGQVLARTRSPTPAAASRSRSPAAPASPPTRSKSSKGSTAPCCWPRSAW